MFRIIPILFLLPSLCISGVSLAQDARCTRVAVVSADNITTVQPELVAPLEAGPQTSPENAYSYPILITRNGDSLPANIRRLIIMKIDADGQITMMPVPSSSIAETLWSLERVAKSSENQIEKKQKAAK